MANRRWPSLRLKPPVESSGGNMKLALDISAVLNVRPFAWASVSTSSPFLTKWLTSEMWIHIVNKFLLTYSIENALSTHLHQKGQWKRLKGALSFSADYL